MISLLWGYLIVSFAWLLFYHSPRFVVRIGCWLVAWGEGRSDMKELHKATYERMTATRGLQSANARQNQLDPNTREEREYIIDLEELNRLPR